jgi:hypothetical protein
MENKEIMYAEYVRLQEVLNSYANSSFEDFQLLAVLGVVLTWEPLSKKIASATNSSVKPEGLLLFGFITLAAIFCVIATRDLMKQSIVFFYFVELAKYEAPLRDAMDISNNQIFNISHDFMRWWETSHKFVSFHFRGFVFALLTILPTLMLWRCSKKHAGLYLASLVIFVSIYLSSVSLILRNPEVKVLTGE